jgi:hypothetical protein
MMKRTLAVVAIGFMCSVAVGQAHVTRIEVLKVEQVPAAQANGEAVPAYQRISGRFYGELDPRDSKNALITDIQLAPKNARGLVEYVGTFSLMKPADMSKASGVLMYSVVNRGNGRASASAEGHVSLVSGWQGDVIPSDTNQTIQVPRARNADGSSITGPFVIRLTGQTGNAATLTMARATTPTLYPPATLDTAAATLVSAVSETPMGVKSGVVKIASTDWAFATCEKTPFPGVPDSTHICLKNGFDPSLLYELRYTAKDPLVLGIGFAATRDLNSFFRYDKNDTAGTANPVTGAIRWAISEGSSQSGTFLRAYIHLGFNQDEQGRIVWDGSNPHIASRVIDMNRRFALPGGTVALYELGTDAPLWWESWNDTPRGRGKTSILDRCRITQTCPKIMETFGAAEIWGLRASAMMVGTDAKADIPLPDTVRRYYFAGAQHGGGRGGFSLSGESVPACELPSNPIPEAQMRAALLKSFVAWVTSGGPMPASRYPKISDGTLVPNTNAAMGFPRIPGKPMPERLQRPLIGYALGSHFTYKDGSGYLTAVPAVEREFPQLVVKVDADGNEIAGLKSPLAMAPLGTYTGWNVTKAGPFKGRLCGDVPTGGFIPFAKTKAERTASGDPRLSLEERYGTHDGYVKAVTAAANSLVQDGLLLRHDADTMIAQAQKSDILN